MDRKIEFVYPTKIVDWCGNLSGTENLLKNRDITPSFDSSGTVRLKNEGGTRAWILLDFGREICGGVRLVSSVVRGITTKLRLVFGESVSEAMSEIGEKGATNHHSPRDFEVMISNLSALEYGHTGYRFVKVVLLEEGAEVAFKSIIGVCSLPSAERVGFIKTNDDVLNRILDTAVYTCSLNMQDGYLWDGIKRDRLVWSGDLYSEIMTIFYSFGETEHICRSLDLLRDSTPDDLWMNNIPSYEAWWILNLCAYYRFSGNESYMHKNMRKVNDILREFDACIDEDGRMDFGRTGKSLGGHVFFLDWPTAETEDAVSGTALLILYAARILQETVGKIADRNVIFSLFQKLQRYILCDAGTKQIAALQILCGNSSAERRDCLEKGGALGFSTFMSYFLLKGLSISGNKCAVNFAKEYYDGMLSRGATTFWEDFDLEWLIGSGRIDELPQNGKKDLHADFGRYCYQGLRHSLCHGWSSGVLPFVYEEVLGLKILEPGFKKVSIRPQMTGLDFVEAKIPTPKGIIEVNAERKGVEIRLPDGIELGND